MIKMTEMHVAQCFAKKTNERTDKKTEHKTKQRRITKQDTDMRLISNRVLSLFFHDAERSRRNSIRGDFRIAEPHNVII